MHIIQKVFQWNILQPRYLNIKSNTKKQQNAWINVLKLIQMMGIHIVQKVYQLIYYSLDVDRLRTIQKGNGIFAFMY